MMNIDVEQVAKLEWATYDAQAEAVRVTPGINLSMRDDVIILTSIFPMPDTNHACLLRTDDHAADVLIDDIIQQFRWHPMPPRIFVSPACSPPDWAMRLEQRGFVVSEGEKEAWITFDLRGFQVPACPPNVAVDRVGKKNMWRFCQVFVKSFGMPFYFTPFMVLMLRPSVHLPHTSHYIASVDGQLAGVCSMLHHGNVGVLGSFGVLPEFRGGRTIYGLAVEAGRVAQARGVETVVLQTTAGTRFERFLRISGFKTLFTRSCYVLQ